jgi:hypothetical protein
MIPDGYQSPGERTADAFWLGAIIGVALGVGLAFAAFQLAGSIGG